MTHGNFAVVNLLHEGELRYCTISCMFITESLVSPGAQAGRTASGQFS